MTEFDDTSDAVVIDGRSCGTCDVCCVALTIDDPELQKPQGFRCKNLVPKAGCGIYETRPKTCRLYNCGWRRMKWIRETLKPDKSRVLVRLQYERPVGDAPPRLGVIFTLLDSQALKAEGLAETVAAAITADVPTYLHIPGPPGYTSSQAKINDVLRHAVMTRDKKAVLDFLRAARHKGKAGKHIPVVLSSQRGGNPAQDRK